MDTDEHGSGFEDEQEDEDEKERVSDEEEEGRWEDRPLLLKLTVNITPYGTMIMIPRY